MISANLVTAAHSRHFSELVRAPVRLTEDGLLIGDEYAMFYAERPLMRRHAERLIEAGCTDLLEIGFGLGVFAQEANTLAPRSYTCIELHPAIAAFARHLLRPFGHPCTVVEGPWQAVLAEHSGRYDAVMLDPVSPSGHGHDDFVRLVTQTLPTLLRPGGIFSFFCCGELNGRRKEALDAVFHDVEVERFSLAGRLPPTWQLRADWFLVHRCVLR